MNTRARRIVIGSSAQIIAGVGLSGLLLTAARVVLGRSLGPESLGVVASFWSLSTMLGAMPISGTSPTVTRFLARYRSENQNDLANGLVSVTLAWAVIAGVGLAAVSVPVTGWLGERIVNSTDLVSILISLLTVPFWTVQFWAVAVFRGLGRTLPSVAIQDVVRPTIVALVLLGLAVLGLLTVRSAVVVFALTIACTGTIAGVTAWRSARTTSSRTTRIREWTTYAAPLSLSMIMQNVAGASVDVLAVSALASPLEAGIYACAATIARMGGLITQATNYPALPLLSTGSDAAKLAVLADARRVSFHLGGAIAWWLIVWADSLISMTFGVRFEAAAWPLRILMVGVLVRTFVGPVGQLLLATGRTRLHLAADLCSVCVFFGGVAVLGSRFGAVGTAGARACSQIAFECVAFLPWVRRRDVIWPPGLAAPVIPTIAMLLALRGLVWLAPPSHAVAFGVCGASLVIALAINGMKYWPAMLEHLRSRQGHTP